MKRLITAALLAIFLSPLAIAQPVPAKLQKLEEALRESKDALEQARLRLEARYSRLERLLTQGREAREIEAWANAIASALEPAFEVAARAQGGRESQQKRALQTLAQAAAKALAAQGEAEGSATWPKDLSELALILGERVRTLLETSGSLSEVLELGARGLAQRALEPLLDQSQAFAVRWNEFISPHDAEAAAFRSASATEQEAAEAFLLVTDPAARWRLGAPEGFARIPAGEYLMQNTAGFASSTKRKPAERFSLSRDVYIGLYEVSVAEWLSWLDTLAPADRAAHRPKGDRDAELWPLDADSGEPRPTAQMLKQPIRGISLQSALLYAKARGARLPTEEEWCAMAGGLVRDGRSKAAWVFGDQYAPNLCNNDELRKNDVVDVGSFPSVQGPFGHFDVAGNVAEWTMTYDNGRKVDPTDLQDAAVAVRGGSFRQSSEGVKLGWVWFRRALFERDIGTGFRLAMDAP